MSKKKFFCCIGNPPYQEEADYESNFQSAIYPQFLTAAYGIAHKVEMITPAKFLFDGGGKGQHDWNQKMLNDEHLKIHDYQADSKKVFRGVDIKGGVAITYHDDTRTYDPIGVFVAAPELRGALAKVMETNPRSLTDIIVSQTRYKLSDALYQEHPEIEEMISKGHKYDVGSGIFSKLENIIFFVDKPDDGDEYVQFLGRMNNQRTYMWMKRKYVNCPENFEHYKVFVPKANGSGALGEVLSTPLIGAPLIGAPLIGATQTFISIGNFDTDDEAQACLKYVKTKFARAMLGVLKATQNNTRETWKYVPMQDFTANSDIDWSQSVADIDRQLYEKYGLDDDEIAFIEKNVKAMP